MISVLVVKSLLVGFDELRAVLYGVTSWVCALRHAGLDLGLDPCYQISVKGEWCLTQKRGATTVASLTDACGTSACSASLRTQARPAIEFVSGEEGLRPKSYHIVFPFASTSSRTPESMQTPMAPVKGQRGTWRGMPPVVRRTSDTFPLLPVQ